MRYGMSWPTGHGRREWVSFGWFGTAVYGLLSLVRLAVLVVVAVVWLLAQVPILAVRAIRRGHARVAGRRPAFMSALERRWVRRQP